ncbi:ABC transporter permease [Paenibacillus sabinae]|uniref:Binding-protein-dependent transport system inner membrane protein n=1 Tax=Paenibacillus sabinae T27 TaxID=1268072 RepID=X4ZM85_9BACL|nr:ABC transporter permease subunit [Paenibacillus sabinae]AHV98332.1 binding-protein-dependent transport system inner membrane protein [Paenibacillus sabinae T27]
MIDARQITSEFINEPVKKRSTIWKRVRQHRALYLMMLPAILYLLINNYLPMFGVIIAFKDINFTKGILHSEWVGFANFKYLFATTDAYVITRNTILYNLAFIIIGLITSVGIAILLNEIRSKISRFYQSALLLPYFISMVIVAYLLYGMLNPEYGFMNKTILPLLHIDPVYWYMEPKYWPLILILVNVWKGVGYSAIVYIASIVGIDQEYYEAAKIDGATKWQQIKHITIPLLVPIMTIMTLLAVGRIFYSDFGLFYQVPMNSGPLLPVTNTIDTYVYRGLMQLGDISMASAAGLYQSLVGFLLVLLSNYVVRKINRDNALF